MNIDEAIKKLDSLTEQIEELRVIFNEAKQKPEELTKIELGYGLYFQIDNLTNEWRLYHGNLGAKYISFGTSAFSDFIKNWLKSHSGKLPAQKELWIAVDDSAVSNLTLSDMPPGRINEDGAYVDYPDNCNYAVIGHYILPSTEPGKLYRCRLEEVDIDDV